MTLKEYLIEHLSDTFYPIITEDKSSFDYTQLKVDLINIAEPAINFFKNNLEDSFFEPKNVDKEAGILQWCPWTEWGWKAFMGEDGTGKGGTYNSKFSQNGDLLSAYFEPLLKQNGLDKDALKTPEKKEEESDKKDKKPEEKDKGEGSEDKKSENEPKGEGKPLSELGDDEKKEIALLMLDGEAPKTAKKKAEEGDENAKETLLFYLKDTEPLKDDAKTLMKNRIIFAVLSKYLYEVYKEINNKKEYKDKIASIAKNIDTIGSISPLYVLLFIMILKYDFENAGNFTAFDENDVIGKLTGDDVDDSIIRDFCIICLAICTMLNAGLGEDQITQLINLTGLLNENA